MPKRKKHKAVIIEGNPYYLNSESKQNYRRYYDEIKDNLHNAGYDDVVFDPGDEYTTPPSADLWVGHSRGAGRLRFAPKGTRTLDITQYEDGIEEYKALMAKEMKKRGYKSVRDFPVHLRPQPGPEHHTLTQRAKDAIMMHKVGERKKLYHGSPHRLDEIRPATATGKGDASAREHAIYLANNPEEARLYALTRPRNNKRKGWAILDNKVHYVKGDPINKQGYVYEHEFDDYSAPPESDPGIGYRVYSAYKPTKRKRVRLRGLEDQFVEHPDKASYKAKVKEWLASREKTSSYREGGSFTHEGTEYDLDHALSLADKQPVTSTRVKDLSWVLRHGKADPERVRRANLSAPLLVSHTSDGRPTVVDGFHRLTKANNEGVANMPTRFVDRKELRKTSEVMGHAAQFNRKQLELMRGLQKKASRRRRVNKIELPYNTDNFLNKYYQQRQGDVINYLSNKYSPKKPRHSVEGTLLARSVKKKQE